jgi:hypothetical protein
VVTAYQRECHGECEGQKAQQAEFEQKVRERPPGGRQPLELRSDDQDPPYDGDQADEQNGSTTISCVLSTKRSV